MLSSALTPPNVLLPDAHVFERRAQRLQHLATGHSLSDWLLWLARLAQVQQSLLDGLADRQPQPQTLLQDAAALWPQFIGQVPRTEGLEKLDVATVHTHLERVLRYANEIEPVADSGMADILAAAALQVAGTWHARHQTPADDLPVTPQHCPCCGAAPVGSILLAGDGKAGLRYMECSLCASRWHAVRARCTVCPSDAVLQYLALEGHHPAVQAECCNDCGGYLKLFSQIKDIAVDPVADDLATLALDVLVGEQGYARAAPNLLLHEGEAVAAH